MMDDLLNIQYSPIHNFKYSKRFEKFEYNDKTLSDAEQKEIVAIIDDAIANYSEGLPLMHEIQKEFKYMPGAFYESYRTVVSVMQFTTILMTDSMVASKYFILADKDYDRRFMRGKLLVILNEGFKRLYGFDDKTYKKSEWDKLLTIMKYYPEEINRQYQELTYLLEKHAKSSSWWKDERDLETHIHDAEKLYMSRQEEIIESKVMIDTMKLVASLLAVNDYLTNLHACLQNYLVDEYGRGELH